MAAHIKSLNVQKVRPPVMPDEAGVLLVSDGSIEVTVAALAINSTISLCVLPAGCVPVDFAAIADDLDSDGSPALTLSFGVLNTDENGLVASTDLLTEDTLGQAGGIARTTAIPDALKAPSASDRIIAAKAIAGAATAQAGTLRGILTYRSEEYGA